VFLKKEEISDHQIIKDDTGIIQKIEFKESENAPDRQIVIETKGHHLVIDPENYNHIEHAYCSTAYKVQSSGDKTRVLAHFDTKQYNVNSSNDLLVKLSSAEKEIIVFTDDAKSLYDSVKREQDKVSILDFASGGQPHMRGEAFSRFAAAHVVGGKGSFLKKMPLNSAKTFDNLDDKSKLIAKISGKFEYRHAAFTQEEFVFGAVDIYSELRSGGETEIEINVKDLKKYFDEEVEREFFMEVGNLGEDTYFSTEQNINIENGIYENTISGQNTIAGFAESKVKQYLECTTLTDGQKDALLFMTSSKDRIRAIQGAPGVGKSFMLNSAKDFYEEEGYKVVALAPSNKAVSNLKERAGFESAATIHAYLIRLQKESGAWATDRNPLDLRQTNLSDLTPGSHKELWFVDEASLIDNYAMNRMLKAAEKKNAEVVLIGDKNQLQPVGAGRPFTNLLKEKKLQYVELNEILRQKEQWTVYNAGKLSLEDKEILVREAKSMENNAAVVFVKTSSAATAKAERTPATVRVDTYKTTTGIDIEIHQDNSLKEAVKDAVGYNIAGSLNKLGSRVHEIEDNVTRLKAIASRYANLPAHERDNTVIITATNRDRTAINDFVRDILKEKGDLGKGSDFKVTDILGKKHVREFATGDKVIFLKKEVFDDHLVNKDDVGEIKKIEGSRITIATQDKDIVVPAHVYDHIDHANCRTTYRVQGADYKNVFANIDTKQSLVNSRNDFLVKISRATHKLELFTDDRYKLYEAVNREQFKVSINDFKSEFYRKGENRIISKLIENITKRNLESSPLSKKVIEDLKRGDKYYIKHLQLKMKASVDLSKADSLFRGRFPTGKARQEAESKTLNHLEIEKKAGEFRKKSEFFYKRALAKHTFTASGIEGILTDRKVVPEVLAQRFEKAFIPGGSIKSLGEFNASKDAFSLSAIDNSFLEVDGPQNYFGPPAPGTGHEQESPGFDGPGEDGSIFGSNSGEGIAGDEDGPGISFDI
jgi:ATP-dependent exoDNAse (exonuclease V) alpha subunit